MHRDSSSSPQSRLEVSPDELMAASSDVVVLDVREPIEFDTGSVPGARSVPAGELRSRLYEIPRRSTVYLLCANGARSLGLVPFMRAVGYDAWSVAGGLWALQDRLSMAGSGEESPCPPSQ